MTHTAPGLRSGSRLAGKAQKVKGLAAIPAQPFHQGGRPTALTLLLMQHPEHLHSG